MTTSVSLVTNIPSPYRISLFNEIARREGIELSVLFMDRIEKNRSWDLNIDNALFDYTFLAGGTRYSYRLDRSVGLNYDLFEHLRSRSPDVVIAIGYSDVTAWLAMVYASITRTPFIPWIGTWHGSVRQPNPIVTAVKRRYVKRGAAWIAYGSQAADYARSLGAVVGEVYCATNTVDVDRWRSKATADAQEQDHNRFELLYVGQLIERKNVSQLVAALDSPVGEMMSLRIVGDGPRREHLEEQAAGTAAKVSFQGMIPRDELVTYYAEADALVLPSRREVWGLVVNEALACGTPVVVSERCGCATDLVREGTNGITFDPETSGALRRALDRCRAGAGDIYGTPEQIRNDAAARFSLSQSAVGVLSAVAAATGS